MICRACGAVPGDVDPAVFVRRNNGTWLCGDCWVDALTFHLGLPAKRVETVTPAEGTV